MGGGTSTTALFVFGDGVLFEQKEQEIKDDYVTGRWWWIGASSRGPSAEIYELTKKWRREGFFMYASKNRWRIDEFVVGSFFFFFFFLVAGNKRAISQRWRNLHQFPNSIGVVTPSPDWVKSFLANPHGNPNDHPPPHHHHHHQVSVLGSWPTSWGTPCVARRGDYWPSSSSSWVVAAENSRNQFRKQGSALSLNGGKWRGGGGDNKRCVSHGV